MLQLHVRFVLDFSFSRRLRLIGHDDTLGCIMTYANMGQPLIIWGGGAWCKTEKKSFRPSADDGIQLDHCNLATIENRKTPP